MDEKKRLEKVKQDLKRTEDQRSRYKEKLSFLSGREADLRREKENLEGRVIMNELKSTGISYDELLKEIKTKQGNNVSVGYDSSKEENPDEEDVESEKAVI